MEWLIAFGAIQVAAALFMRGAGARRRDGVG